MAREEGERGWRRGWGDKISRDSENRLASFYEGCLVGVPGFARPPLPHLRVPSAAKEFQSFQKRKKKTLALSSSRAQSTCVSLGDRPLFLLSFFGRCFFFLLNYDDNEDE